jgi:putative ABC transport system substrate-binding protein
MCEAQSYAQQLTTAKIAKVGELVFRDRVTPGPGREVFRQRLYELGYVEGKNIIFETRSAKGRLDRFSALAQELVNLKVDVLVASSTAEALAFKHATSTIPIVFMIATDPVGDALVTGLAHPGGNITGITTSSTTLSGKRLELLRESVPKVLRVGVLWNPQDPNDAQQWKESQLAARELGLQLSSIEVSSADKYEAGFKEATQVHCDALALLTGPLASAHQKQITTLAGKFRQPVIYPRRDFVENGGLISYGPDRAESYRRAAVMVDKILKGAKPADLPVGSQPSSSW